VVQPTNNSGLSCVAKQPRVALEEVGVKHHIVILDRDPTTVGILQFILRDTGYHVSATANGAEATGIVQLTPPELVLLDPELRPVDGLRLLADWRTGGYAGACIIVSSRATLDDQLRAFELGVDDYVTKPFELKVVLARLDALARRAPDRKLTAEGLVLDPMSHSVRTELGQVRLSPTEFRMLAAITSRPGEVVRRRSVIAAAWPDGAIVSDNTVDSFIRRLRRKLETIDSPTGIETVRGVGFTMTRRHE
jgi:two-component system response regulator MprA